ncbi:IS3 family transposase, partial [Vibrio toranzoniae]|uniref:IS3 family transposase n=1 Tax=Vibrio toranzoniae TaxID=1194427 RepID=UPI001F02BDEB
LKYEEVYLKAYTTPREAELEIGNYMVFYNEERNHQGLNDLTPRVPARVAKLLKALKCQTKLSLETQYLTRISIVAVLMFLSSLQ